MKVRSLLITFHSRQNNKKLTSSEKRATFAQCWQEHIHSEHWSPHSLSRHQLLHFLLVCLGGRWGFSAWVSATHGGAPAGVYGLPSPSCCSHLQSEPMNGRSLSFPPPLLFDFWNEQIFKQKQKQKTGQHYPIYQQEIRNINMAYMGYKMF